MKGKLRFIKLLFGLPLVFVLFSCNDEGADNASPAGGNTAPPPPRADVFVVEKQAVQDVLSATGTVLANESVVIHPERTGQLEQLYIQEGGYVKNGALLGKLDDSELQAQLSKLKIQAEYQENEIKRAKSLLEIQGISREEFDRLANQLAQAQADIRLIEVQIDKTNIRAPFSGQLGLRMISEGAYVTPSTEIITLQQTDPVKLEFDVPEKYSRLVAVGQKVKFTVEGISKPLEAKVYATAPFVSQDTRSLRVRALCPNASNLLKPGNFAKVELFTRDVPKALLVPTDAVLPVLGGQQVYLLKNGKIQAQQVSTGQRSEQSVEIVEGLTEGDTILVSALLTLRPGMPVQAGNIIELPNAGE